MPRNPKKNKSTLRLFVNTPKRTVFRENRIFRWGGCFFDGLSVFFTSAFADVPHQLLKVNDCYKLKKKNVNLSLPESSEA